MMPVLTNNQIVRCAGIRNLETSPEARQNDSAQNYIPKRWTESKSASEPSHFLTEIRRTFFIILVGGGPGREEQCVVFVRRPRKKAENQLSFQPDFVFLSFIFSIVSIFKERLFKNN